MQSLDFMGIHKNNKYSASDGFSPSKAEFVENSISKIFTNFSVVFFYYYFLAVESFAVVFNRKLLEFSC